MKNFEQQSISKILFFTAIFALISSCSKDDNMQTETVNTAPIAVISSEQKVEIGKKVQLDASGSSDSEDNSLTYKWALINKPVESDASIIGVGNVTAEFNLDRAGNYEIELTVSDGKLETKVAKTITNKTPVINEIRANFFSGSISFDTDNIVSGGREVDILGNFFSEILNDITVTIDGKTCEVKSIDVFNSGGQIIVTVPDNVTTGDLILKIGSESTTWSKTMNAGSAPVEKYVTENTHLEQKKRSEGNVDLNKYFEIGSKFKPLENGKIFGFILKAPKAGDYNINLWNNNAKTVLKTETVAASSPGTRLILFSEPVNVEKDKEYTITLNSNDWYLYIDEQDAQGNQFPKTYNNIELLSTVFRETTNGVSVFPDQDIATNYIVKGADIIFAEDPK